MGKIETLNEIPITKNINPSKKSRLEATRSGALSAITVRFVLPEAPKINATP